jgi:hypothetical protein
MACAEKAAAVRAALVCFYHSISRPNEFTAHALAQTDVGDGSDMFRPAVSSFDARPPDQ